MIDSDVAYMLEWCSVLRPRITIHLRGTDERPVIVIKDRSTRREIGGTELRRRIEAHFSK